MAELVLEAKRRALGDEPPESILELIEQKVEPRARPEEHEPAATSPAALGALERNAEAVSTQLSAVSKD